MEISIKKEDILDKTNNGLEVFKHYIQFDFKVGRNFLNPLYEDSRASCNVYFDRHSGVYKLKDFGNDQYSGDCFAFVGFIHNLNCDNARDFTQILSTINRDLSLCLSSEGKKASGGATNKISTNRIHLNPVMAKTYQIEQKALSHFEMNYWAKYTISIGMLNKYNVISINKYSNINKDDKPFDIVSTNDEPIFGYVGINYIKIYRPYSQIRFLYGGEIPDNYCFGLEQLPAKGDTLFITGGEKDVMSLAAQGFNAICFNSESSNIPKELVQKLSYRFKHIIILYDMDSTGLKSSAKHEEQLKDLSVKRLLLPLSGVKEEKDISDYFRLGKTREDFIHLFIDLLDTLYSETLSALQSCEINLENPPITAQTVISINDVPIGTQGNMLCITGGEGTGKSHYVNTLISGSMRTRNDIDTLGTYIQASTGKAVLLYDTEQSDSQLYSNVLNLLRRSEQKQMPDNLKIFCLTGMSRKERLLAIIQSIYRFYYEFGIHFIVIDGVADLIQSANDEGESIRLVDELHRLAGIYNICIVCVLHSLPAGMKLRGHLGSELQRKAAAILSIEKDNDPNISVIKALKVRDGSPLDVPLIQFAWDKEVGMHCYIGEKPKEEKERRKELELIAVAKKIFKEHKQLSYMAICEQLQSILDVKERTAKGYVSFMKDKSIISKDPSNSNYMIGDI